MLRTPRLRSSETAIFSSSFSSPGIRKEVARGIDALGISLDRCETEANGHARPEAWLHAWEIAEERLHRADGRQRAGGRLRLIRGAASLRSGANRGEARSTGAPCRDGEYCPPPRERPRVHTLSGFLVEPSPARFAVDGVDVATFSMERQFVQTELRHGGSSVQQSEQPRSARFAVPRRPLRSMDCL